MWKMEVLQTKQHAILANEVIEHLKQECARYPFDNCTKRTHVALALLISSIDVAAAATRLLIIDPVQYGGAAEAMFRPQLERYMRAVYFGSPQLTIDEKVHAFLEADDIDISFKKLAKAVSEEIIRQGGGKPGSASPLADALTMDEDVHGSVHGGRIVLHRYLSTSDGVAHNPGPLSEGALITVMMAVALLAFSQVAHLHGSDFVVSDEFATLSKAAMPGIPDPKPTS